MSAAEFFGKEINWKSFREGLQEISEYHKPGIILIGKQWCPSCKKIGLKFQSDKELIELSRNFVMISCYDDEEPDYDDFRPGMYGTALFNVDGVYYPRFFFIDSSGTINYSISSGKAGEPYRYFYSSVYSFKDRMRQLLQ